MAKKKKKTSKKINLDEISSVSEPDEEGKITVKVKKESKQVEKEVKEEFDWDNHKIKKNNDNFFGLL
jgi:hypothetical protein